MKARDNPLSTGRLEQVKYRLPGITWDNLLHRFELLGRRAALIGAHGSGKTTLLGEFASHWANQGFRTHSFRLSTARPGFTPEALQALSAGFGDRDIVLLDGAEQLSFLGWRRFRKASGSARGVLITAHRPGRLPTLLECATTPGLLAALASELAPGHVLCSTSEQWRALFDRHRGNLRDALRELYDILAARPPVELHGFPESRDLIVR